MSVTDDMARALGYGSADQWLDLVAFECRAGVVEPNRLAEHADIFWPERAITVTERDLIAAHEGADWPQLHAMGAVSDDGEHLTQEATRTYLAALAALEALR